MTLNKRFLLFFSLSFFVFIAGCKKKEIPCELSEEILASKIDLEIVRMEVEFYNGLEEDSLNYLLEIHPLFTEKYLEEVLYENREELVRSLVQMYKDSSMVELYEEVMLHFEDIGKLEKDLENAFKYILHYYPDFKVPKVYTQISGFSSDLFITEDILVIGLDYFLPADHRFQPGDLPLYITNRYDADHLVPTIVTAISSRYNETNLSDNTLLAEMIYYGKAYHFTKTILPCTKDEYIIGYTSKNISDSYANEELIWSHFIENELLFETNPFTMRKYTGEAPFTDEISTDAPGRLGRWLGWNIVDDYRFNNGMSIQELMQEPDAAAIFRKSGYKPRR